VELDDESLFNFEGLFEFRDEDTYSRRSYVSDRLHDHIERSKDKCWHLYVVRGVSPEGHLLGWSVCAVLSPTLTSEATTDEIAAEVAHILELNQFRTYSEAVMAVNGIILFMTEEGRVEEPEYAYMDDSFVLELMSVQCSVEETATPEWEVLKGDNLREFL